MARTFWQSYQSFLAEARSWTGQADEEAVIQTVREWAKGNREQFQEWVRSHGWGVAYVERHLLYVAEHPAPVRELLRRGYPLRRIPLRSMNLEALEHALNHTDWRIQVEQLFQRVLLPDWASKPVWLFESSAELRHREGLAAPVAQAVVEISCPAGGLVVDPMAGKGSILQAARQTGRSAWGGDLKPQSAEVTRADISELLKHVPVGTADALVLHPPTFTTWSRTADEMRDVPVSEHYSAYLDFIVHLLQHSAAVVRQGGQVVLIARPPRRGQVYLAPFELALGEYGLMLSAYHLAVSRDGIEDWHFFIARTS